MNRNRSLRDVAMLLITLQLSACASTGELIDTPKLRNVQIEEMGFSTQTFLLGFDVSNPNPFPLPVSAVSYNVELDGYRFATGNTQAGFTVPANGDGEFAISVQLNLLNSAPQLLYIVQGGRKRDIPYVLEGRLGIDIPLVEPIAFETAGAIRLRSRAD